MFEFIMNQSESQRFVEFIMNQRLKSTAFFFSEDS